MRSLLLIILSLVVGACVALYLTGQLDGFVKIAGGRFGIGDSAAEDSLAAAVTISPEAAADAEEKLRNLRPGQEVRLNESEVTSLLRYRPELWTVGGMS